MKDGWRSFAKLKDGLLPESRVVAEPHEPQERVLSEVVKASNVLSARSRTDTVMTLLVGEVATQGRM
jgi:hypothetical protein